MSPSPTPSPHPLLLSLLLLLSAVAALAQLPGSWEVLLENAGIASMHTAVTRFGTVVLLDRTENGPSRLPCRPAATNCTAHSALFDPATNSLRPLSIATDTWCSSGQFLPDGTLLHSGGHFDGYRKFRTFIPCSPSKPTCDWHELTSPLLAAGRWYATNQILPDGTVIIIGGRAIAPTVEFYPPRSPSLRPFPFLTETQDPQLDNLYPFVHLLPDGNLFIFANAGAILYETSTGDVLRKYPILPGGPRNYPSVGSSTMLPLSAHDGFSKAEVVVCGGAQYGAFLHRDNAAPAKRSCGRIVATEASASWAEEDMPFPRIMGDMVMLPTGEILIVNGAQAGSQGFKLGSNPCLNPVLYRPDQPIGHRFMTLTRTAIPRMYHSTANLLPDGRVLVAGSNPHKFYKYGGEFPTELRLEAFLPEYLSADRANLRPAVEATPERVSYGGVFEIQFAVELPLRGVVAVNLASAPFATHSFSQGQRLVKLAVSPVRKLGFAGGGDAVVFRYRVECTAPPDGKVAPPGYYMLFAINQGVPSVARWVQLVL